MGKEVKLHFYYDIFVLNLQVNGNVGAICSSNTTGGSVVTGPSLNTWGHTAAVFANTDSRTAYSNGTAGPINTATHVISAPNFLTIGARYEGSYGLFFAGPIAEVGIWSAALTAAEIASLAKGMTCDKVRPQSLVFYSPLVRDLIDQKGGLTITNNNGATAANHPIVYA
jgi:hypothetical protein